MDELWTLCSGKLVVCMPITSLVVVTWCFWLIHHYSRALIIYFWNISFVHAPVEYIYKDTEQFTHSYHRVPHLEWISVIWNGVFGYLCLGILISEKRLRRKQTILSLNLWNFGRTSFYQSLPEYLLEKRVLTIKIVSNVFLFLGVSLLLLCTFKRLMDLVLFPMKWKL